LIVAFREINCRCRNFLFWGAAGLIPALLSLMAVLNFPDEDLFWNELQNFAHIPLFGVIALLALYLCNALNRPAAPPIWCYGAAFVTTMTIGFFSELLQMPGPRDADFGDLIKDAAGASCALAFYATYAGHRFVPVHHLRRFLIRAAVVGIIAYFVWPVGLEAATKIAHMRVFPLICDFEGFLRTRLIEHNEHAGFNRVRVPVKWQTNKSRYAGCVTFEDGAYPGFAFCNIRADWKDFNRLTFIVFSKEKRSVELHCRIHDTHHNNEYADRFNITLTIKPGGDTIEIPLDQVAGAPEGRTMDMSAIDCIGIFMVKPLRPVTLYFDDFKLER